MSIWYHDSGRQKMLKNNDKGWLILHHYSPFSQILVDMLGHSAQLLSTEELVMQTRVFLDLDNGQNSVMSTKAYEVNNFQSKIVFHEGFYQLGEVLHSYFPADRSYVQSSWQSLLLSLFSQMKYVVNPLAPQNMGITAFQIPYILQAAHQVGFIVPNYELLPKCSSFMQSSLWYLPKNHKETQVKLQAPKGELIVVSFVRQSKGCYRYWPQVPLGVRMRLKLLCETLRLDAGEAYFYVEKNWVFYGIRPGFSQERNETVLEEVALCIKELGDNINKPE
jgi:hypothetical protein